MVAASLALASRSVAAGLRGVSPSYSGRCSSSRRTGSTVGYAAASRAEADGAVPPVDHVPDAAVRGSRGQPVRLAQRMAHRWGYDPRMAHRWGYRPTHGPRCVDRAGTGAVRPSASHIVAHHSAVAPATCSSTTLGRQVEEVLGVADHDLQPDHRRRASRPAVVPGGGVGVSRTANSVATTSPVRNNAESACSWVTRSSGKCSRRTCAPDPACGPGARRDGAEEQHHRRRWRPAAGSSSTSSRRDVRAAGAARPGRRGAPGPARPTA